MPYEWYPETCYGNPEEVAAGRDRELQVEFQIEKVESTWTKNGQDVDRYVILKMI